MCNILVTTEVSTDATTEVITTQQVTTPVVSTTQTITTEEGTTLPPTTGLEIENYLERIKTVFNIYLLLLSVLFQHRLCFVMKCFGVFKTCW